MNYPDRNNLAKRLPSLLSILALTCNSAATFGDDGRNPDSAFREGKAAVEGDRLVDAYAFLEEAHTGEPGNRTYALELGRVCVELGRLDRAIEVLLPLSDSGDDIDALRVLGRAYADAGRLVEARRCLRQVLESRGATPADRIQLGNAFLLEDRCALALRQFRDAEAAGFAGPELHVALAKAYTCLGEYVGVLAIVKAPNRKVNEFHDDKLLINPGNGEGMFIAAPQESAAYHLQLARDLGDGSVETRLLEAQVWLKGRQYSRAVRAYASLEAEMLKPRISATQRADFFAGYSDALFAADDTEGCLAKFQQAIEFNVPRYGPQLADVLTKIARQYNLRGDLDGYIKHLQMAAAERPTSVDLHYRLGNGLMEAGRRAEAVRHWRITFQLAPDHPDRARMLAEMQAIAESGD